MFLNPLLAFAFAIPIFNNKEFNEKLGVLNKIALEVRGEVHFSSYVPAELLLESNPTIMDRDKLYSKVEKSLIKPIDAAKYIGQNFVDSVGMAGIVQKRVEEKFPELKGTIIKFGSRHGAVRFDFLLQKSATDKAVKGTYVFDIGKTAVYENDHPVVALLHGGEPVQNPSDVAGKEGAIRSYRFNDNDQVIETNKKGKDCIYENTTLEGALKAITEYTAIRDLMGRNMKASFFFMERYPYGKWQLGKKTFSNGISFSNTIEGETKLVDFHDDNSLPSKKVIARHSRGLDKLRAFLVKKNIASLTAPGVEASKHEKYESYSVYVLIDFEAKRKELLDK